MSLDYEVERNRVVLPTGAKEGQGVRPPDPPSLTEITDQSLDARTVAESLRSLKDSTATAPHLIAMAKVLGAAYFVGNVTAITDTEFVHNLNRLPVCVLMSVDLGGMGGQVVGRPEGGVGQNANPWTQGSIFVRATRVARYAFLVM